MKWINFLTAAALIAPAVHAESFDSLTGVDASAERQAIVGELRARLTSHAPDINGLGNILTMTGENGKAGLTSSFKIKEMLASASEKMLTETTYGTPLVLSPQMTIDELDRSMAINEMAVCLGALNKKGYEGKNPSDMEQLLQQFRVMAFIAKEKAKNKTASAASALSQPELQAMQSLRNHLANAPKNAKGQTIESIMGQAQDLDLYNNHVRTVFFTKGGNVAQSSDAIGYDKKIAASLSMVISKKQSCHHAA